MRSVTRAEHDSAADACAPAAVGFAYQKKLRITSTTMPRR